VHDLDATQNDPRAAKALEPKHRSNDAFDRSMVLLNHIIQILDLTNLDGCVAPSVYCVQRGQIGATFVDRCRLGHPVLFDRFLEIPLGRSLVAPGAQKKVDRIAFLVYGPVEILPNAPNLHIGFVHPPAFADCPLAATKRLFKHG